MMEVRYVNKVTEWPAWKGATNQPAPMRLPACGQASLGYQRIPRWPP